MSIRRYLLVCLGLAATALPMGACASSGEVRCKPTDNSVSICEMRSHEECEDLDNGCQRCTCVLDRPEDIEHGPLAPE